MPRRVTRKVPRKVSGRVPRRVPPRIQNCRECSYPGPSHKAAPSHRMGNFSAGPLGDPEKTEGLFVIDIFLNAYTDLFYVHIRRLLQRPGGLIQLGLLTVK